MEEKQNPVHARRNKELPFLVLRSDVTSLWKWIFSKYVDLKNWTFLKLLTIKEAVEKIGRSTDFIRDEVAKKKLAHHRLGGRYYVSDEDLSEYLSRSRVAAYGETVRKKSQGVVAR
jgi:excisionase family DNA binding protein